MIKEIKIFSDLQNEHHNCCFRCTHGCCCNSCTQGWPFCWKQQQFIWIFSADHSTKNLHCQCRQGWHLHHCSPQELSHNPWRPCMCQSHSSLGLLLSCSWIRCQWKLGDIDTENSKINNIRNFIIKITEYCFWCNYFSKIKIKYLGIIFVSSG